MPLMKRTVRDDNGAWSLLKNAPVRASDTASSWVAVVASERALTPRIEPARSTTATASVGSDSDTITGVQDRRDV